MMIRVSENQKNPHIYFTIRHIQHKIIHKPVDSSENTLYNRNIPFPIDIDCGVRLKKNRTDHEEVFVHP